MIKKILVVGYYDYPIYEAAWVKGLEGCGVQVRQFNLRDAFKFRGPKSVENSIAYFFNNIHDQLSVVINQETFDIILIYKGYHLSARTIRMLAEVSWLTGYDNDDIFGSIVSKFVSMTFRRKLKHFKSYHCYRRKNVPEYSAYIKYVGKIESYYLPWLHRLKPHLKKKYDVVFIGHYEKDNRSEFMKYLIDNDVKVRIFGPAASWRTWTEHDSQRSEIYPVLNEEYVDTIIRSRICLCFFSKGNNDTYTRRVFEIPACGTFLLSERTTDMLAIYKEANEAEYFSSKEELLRKVQYYLAHSDEREAIALNGNRKCLEAGYDVFSKMKLWMTDMNEFQRLEGIDG